MDLPDDLALPLERGAPWWYWTGGRPALDLVNTLRERWWRGVETLVSRRRPGRWLVAAGLLERGTRPPGAAAGAARVLREASTRSCRGAGRRAGLPRRARRDRPRAAVRRAAGRARPRADGSLVLRPAAPVARAAHALGARRPRRGPDVRRPPSARGSGSARRTRAAPASIDRSPAAAAGAIAPHGLRQRRQGPPASPRAGREEQRMTEVQSGLEGVVAFETEIAEPDRDGGALRYRGVDIEDLAGRVALRAGLGPARRRRSEPGLRPSEPLRPAGAHSGDPRADVAGRARDARADAARPADRRRRRAGARRPRADRRRSRSTFVAQSARGAGPPAGPAVPRSPGRHVRRALPDPLARRGRSHATRGDRRLLGLRRRARHERLDVHRPRRRLDGRGRAAALSGAVGALSGPLHGGAPSRVLDDARRGRARAATRTRLGAGARSTAASG